MTEKSQAPEGGPTLHEAALQALVVLQALEFTEQQPTFSSGAWIKAGAPAAIDKLAAALGIQPQAALAYQQANPLGGPAKVFRAMADAIEAGDSYEDTLRRFEYAEAKPAPAEGDVVVTWDQDRTRILAVTRQDDEGRIISVIAKAPAPAPDMRDAYVGAREDLAIWKRRALAAEKDTRRLDCLLNDFWFGGASEERREAIKQCLDESEVIAFLDAELAANPSAQLQAPAPEEPTELEQRKRDYARALDAIKGHVEYISLLEQKLRELQLFKDGVELHQRGGSNSWYWLDDRENYLETMVASLPVVIRAEQLRELLAAPQAPAVPHGKEEQQ